MSNHTRVWSTRTSADILRLTAHAGTFYVLRINIHVIGDLQKLTMQIHPQDDMFLFNTTQRMDIANLIYFRVGYSATNLVNQLANWRFLGLDKDLANFDQPEECSGWFCKIPLEKKSGHLAINVTSNNDQSLIHWSDWSHLPEKAFQEKSRTNL